MDRVSTRFIGSTLLAIAISILLVGVVWASSTAQQTSPGTETVSSTTTPSDDGDGDTTPGDDDSGADSASDIDELRDQVATLTAQVENLSALVTSLTTDVDKIDSLSKKTSARVDVVQTLAEEASKDATRAVTTANDLANRVVVVEARTTQLNDQGVYFGSVNPDQLSRKLTPTDLRGEWPLDRVQGDLDSKYLLMPFSGNCSTRYGYYSVLVADAFRRIACARIPE